MSWRSTCINPFNKPRHASKKSLRPVTQQMCEICPELGLTTGAKICDGCRKQLQKARLVDDRRRSSIESVDDPEYIPPELSTVNECLRELGETPWDRRKASRSKKYSEAKVEKITQLIDKVTLGEEKQEEGDESEMLSQLKQKFLTASERSLKVQILTILPMSWSIERIQSEFGASNFMARKAKQLVKQHGILATPNLLSGRPSLTERVASLVTSFYEDNSASRTLAGKKDFVSVRGENGREHVQKRLILNNLKELYQEFKEKHPTEKIGFSKFAELRPKHCVLAGASGTHSVCVCTIHQNVKLMIQGVKMQEIPSYHSCIAKTICNPPLPRCFLGECNYCPGVEQLTEDLSKLLEENLIDSITYKQWTTTDRSNLETVTLPSDEFVELLCEKVQALTTHSFIATQQNKFFEGCKESLVPGKVVVCADFSENYAFVLQDAAQGFHWNNSQATIHPFVIYFRETTLSTLSHLSFVVISDCLHHDTIAVYLFQKQLITFLKATLPQVPTEILYFSDGAASQYKNRKNFINLCLHAKDFGIPAQWHFSATSHGKGACDGLGGTVKRLAARASLQRPYDNQIMTPFQLYSWATTNVPAVSFVYCSMEEYQAEKAFLEPRFKLSRTITGTRGLHSFIPKSSSTMTTRRYSFSTDAEDEIVTKLVEELEMDEVIGYVLCVYESSWWLACILEKDIENAEVKVTLLHPHGPSRSFKYPSIPEIVVLPLINIISVVNPRTTTGRTYTVLQKDSKKATSKLKDFYP